MTQNSRHTWNDRQLPGLYPTGELPRLSFLIAFLVFAALMCGSIFNMSSSAATKGRLITASAGDVGERHGKRDRVRICQQTGHVSLFVGPRTVSQWLWKQADRATMEARAMFGWLSHNQRSRLHPRERESINLQSNTRRAS